MTSASTPSRSISLMRRCGSPGRRMPSLPSSYMPVAAILSTRSCLPGTCCVPDAPTPPANEREPLLAPNLVDDLEDPGVQPGVLDPELLAQAAPVHQVVAGVLASTLLGKGDLRVGEKSAHDVRQLAEARRDPPRTVEMMAGGVGHQHAGEDLRDVLHVNQQAHEPLRWKVKGAAASGLGHDLHVVRRAADLVRPRDVGGPDAPGRT